MFVRCGAPTAADCRRLLRRRRSGYARSNRWAFSVVGMALRFGEFRSNRYGWKQHLDACPERSGLTDSADPPIAPVRQRCSRKRARSPAHAEAWPPKPRRGPAWPRAASIQIGNSTRSPKSRNGPRGGALRSIGRSFSNRPRRAFRRARLCLRRGMDQVLRRAL